MVTRMSDFTELVDLASGMLGGGVVGTNDELFAAADNLVRPEPPTYSPRTFGPKGQVYDGWETRRRRSAGHDWAIVRLGAPGVIRGVVVDTAFFTGNYPPYASVEACGVEGYPTAEELTGAEWVSIVDRSALTGDSVNPFPVSSASRFTHVRLNIHPDGGVARLRVHGEVLPDPRLLAGLTFDLAAMEYGGVVEDCSNRFYGSANRLLAPGLARSMGDGWETARRRDDGNDWVQVRLAVPGRIRLAELDTSHFKGNAPGRARLLGRTAMDEWVELMPATGLRPDTRHRFRLTGPDRVGGDPGGGDRSGADTVTVVRLDVYPDGGMARLRLVGDVAPADLDALLLRWFNALPEAHAREVAERRPATGHSDHGLPADLVAARPLSDPGPLRPLLP